MNNALSVCSSYLDEVEEKLIELQWSMNSDPEERAAKISEALSLVREAQHELSTTRSSTAVHDIEIAAR